MQLVIVLITRLSSSFVAVRSFLSLVARASCFYLLLLFFISLSEGVFAFDGISNLFIYKGLIPPVAAAGSVVSTWIVYRTKGVMAGMLVTYRIVLVGRGTLGPS